MDKFKNLNMMQKSFRLTYC